MNAGSRFDFYRVMKARARTARTAARRVGRARLKEIGRMNALFERLQDHDPRSPRQEVLFAPQHVGPIVVPDATLSAAHGFCVPETIIRSECDVRRFVTHFFGAAHQLGEPIRYPCPKHPTLADQTVSLVERPPHAPLVHCCRCGYRLNILEFLFEMSGSEHEALQMAERIWPEKIGSREINGEQIKRIRNQHIRRVGFEAGRVSYAAHVVEADVPAAFGDWSALDVRIFAALLLYPDIPPELAREVYLLHLLRTWSGELKAVDVYNCGYEPEFRYWLTGENDEPLFAVPAWTEYCERTKERLVCTSTEDAHALEIQAAALPASQRRPIWLRCGQEPFCDLLSCNV